MNHAPIETGAASTRLFWKPGVFLALLSIIYFLATLPYLDRYPFLEAAQMGIAAPAYKLAEEGTYGNDLFRGFFQTERYNFEYMPLYPVLVAASFRLLRLGVWQARLVSVLAGFATLLLTYSLGRVLASKRVGFLAAAFLCLLPVAVPQYGLPEIYPGAVPLLDFARVIRYDILVPVWTLSAMLVFHQATSRGSAGGYFLAGLLTALATLSHIYGAFLLAVFAVACLVWRGFSALRRPQLYLVPAGWIAGMLPWLIWAGTHFDAFSGQMQRHETRFNLLDPVFYASNLLREPWRYLRIIGGFRRPILFPRPGFWLLILTAIVGAVVLAAALRRNRSLSLSLALVSAPVLMLMLGLLISFKRYPYLALVLPSIAILAAVGLEALWRWSRGQAGAVRALLVLLVLAAAFEGLAGIWSNLAQARSASVLSDLLAETRDALPADARLLMLHAYWIEFAEYDTYALDLVFQLADQEVMGPDAAIVQEVLEGIDPEFILVQEQLLRQYENPDQAGALPRVIEKWRSLADYLASRCELFSQTRDDRDYGVISVYACGRS